MLKRYGISIKSTTEYFENTPAGRFMENIIANVSQFDNDVRTERAVNGSRDAMIEGRYVWIAPLGYSNIKVGGKGTIAPNHMAPAIRQAFEEIAKNQYPIEEVRKLMFHAGLTNYAGKPVARAYFYRMLKNEVYAGWIVKFGERHKGTFDAIVPEALFEQVQLVLHHRTRKNYSYNTKHPDFPLRRFVTHPEGMKLTGSWNQGKYQKYPYYRYMGKKLNFRKETLESDFMAFMDTYGLRPEHLKPLKDKLRLAFPKGVTSREKDMQKIHYQVKELKQRQTLLIEKNVQGIISNSILKEQLDTLDRQIIDLNAKLYVKPTLNVNIDELMKTAEQLLITPSKAWLRANNENRLKLQVFEFPQGITFDGHVFQTPEICKLFKLKDFFLTQKSPSAGVREKVIKSILYIANPPNKNGGKIKAEDNYNSRKFWKNVIEELIEANDLITKRITETTANKVSS